MIGSILSLTRELLSKQGNLGNKDLHIWLIAEVTK